MDPGRLGRLCLVLLLTIGSGQVSGQEQIDLPGPDQPPSLELLEFLGEWQTDDGEWIDPAGLEHLDLPTEEENHDESK